MSQKVPKLPPIPTGLEAPDSAWKELPLTALPQAEIMPGHVITGFGSFKQINIVEEAACKQIELTTGSSFVGGIGGYIAKNRLADMLRPEDFNGGLLDAHAMVFPFEAERVRQYKSFRANLSITDRVGLTFLFMANMRSRGAVSGSLLAEVSYYEGEAGLRSRSFPVTRLLGGVSIATVPGGFKQIAQESAARAQEVASYALRHVYQGGLPGLGKSGK